MQARGRGRPAPPGGGDTSSDSGFTLVEVLVASTVLTIGIVGAVQVMHSSFDVASRTSARARAVAAAVDEIETARSTPFENLDVADADDPPEETSETIGGSQ